jgi:hypothetical protein
MKIMPARDAMFGCGIDQVRRTTGMSVRFSAALKPVSHAQ